MGKNNKILGLNERENLKDTRLIIFFSFLVLIVVFFYISFRLYQNKRKPLTISSQTYALFETKSNLPENTFLDLGVTSYDSLREETDILNGLKYCDSGDCVMDIKSGIKRCPADKNTKLISNPVMELCTVIDRCPDVQPFAVQSTGETKLKTCEEGIPCRCIKEKYCAPYVSETLQITNGNPWVKQNGFKNFSITGVNSGNEQGFNLDPLVISSEDSTTRFCKINPEFSQRIENGCVFTVNSGEPMDCNSGSYLTIFSPISSTFTIYQNDQSSHTTTTDIKYDPKNPTGSISPKLSANQILLYDPTTAWNTANQNNQYIQQNIADIPESGVFGDGTTYFSYKGVINNHSVTFSTTTIETDAPSTHDNYSNITTILLNVRYNGQPGIPSSLKAGDNLKLFTITYADCNKNLLPTDNYKNMLNCVQDENQPCKTGQLAYNVDDADPRTFAQYNPNMATRQLENYLLKSSSFYTVSCVNGGGCSKIIDLSLCGEKDCSDSYTEKKSRFFSEIDDSAIATEWLLTTSEGVNGYSQNYTLDETNGTVTIKMSESLLNLENGDYWSVFNSSIYSYGICNYPAGTTVFKLNSIDNIKEGMCVSYGGICGTNPDNPGVKSIDVENTTVTLYETSYQGICYGDQFTFYNTLNDGDYGIITNCTTVENTNNNIVLCHLSDLYGLNLTNVNLGSSPYIHIYKQYGFNGINYNTNAYNGTDEYSPSSLGKIYDPSSHQFNLRKYSTNSYINLNFNNQDVYNTISKFNPPLNITNIYNEKDNTYNETFSDPFSLFKTQNSMYYPVWNNNTFKQECIIPLPCLIAYPVVDIKDGKNDKIDRIAIQFSGKHYDQYSYYEDNYCYSLCSNIKKKILITDLVSSNNLIVLDKTNPDISKGNIIADNNCSFEVYFELDKKS